MRFALCRFNQLRPRDHLFRVLRFGGKPHLNGLTSHLLRREFQKILFRQKAVFARELVSGCGHFLDDGVARDEVVLWESEVAGSFVGVEVDDGDARAWFERRSEVAEVF